MHPLSDKISTTGTPRTMSASATNERWQRHGTASAHMIATRFSRLVRMSAASASGNSAVCI